MARAQAPGMTRQVTDEQHRREERSREASLCLFTIVLLSAFAGSFSINLINLALQQRGATAAAIGASTAIQAAGIVAAALSAVPVLNLLGSARALAAGALLAGAALAAAGLLEDPAGVNAARFLFGLGLGTLVANLEYVIIARAPRRATVVAIYGTVFAAGGAFGPALVGLLGSEPAAYAFGTGSLLVAALLVGTADIRIRSERKVAAIGTPASLGLAPFAFVAALMFGLLDNGVLSLISVFAIQNGHSALDASTLAATGLIGALLFQIPAGRLSDRFSPHATLMLCSAAALLCIVGIVRAPADRHVVLPLMLVLGGACEGFYTLGLAAMGRTVPRTYLAAGNACFIGLCGTGEVLGPLVAISGSSIAGPSGFIGVFALALLIYLGALLVHLWYSRLPHVRWASNSAGFSGSSIKAGLLLSRAS